MKPPDGRPVRRGQRRAWRGLRTGRRGTHRVETTYGAGQKRQADTEEFSAWCAQRRESLAPPDAAEEEQC